MSIHYDMTNLQEGFIWGIPNSDDPKGGGKEIEKQSLLLQPFEPSENLVPIAKKSIKSKKRAKKDGKDHIDDDDESQDHEIHIWTERERRKKMRNMFNNLHALLPQLPPKGRPFSCGPFYAKR